MLERILIVVGIVVAVYAVWGAVRLWTRYRIAHVPVASQIAELDSMIAPGRAAVLAFSTPGCTECRSLQRPALETLAASQGDIVQIAHLSVPEHPSLVERWGILSVPATVILDTHGKTRFINLSYTSADRLRGQLAEIG